VAGDIETPVDGVFGPPAKTYEPAAHTPLPEVHDLGIDLGGHGFGGKLDQQMQYLSQFKGGFWTLFTLYKCTLQTDIGYGVSAFKFLNQNRTMKIDPGPPSSFFACTRRLGPTTEP